MPPDFPSHFAVRFADSKDKSRPRSRATVAEELQRLYTLDEARFRQRVGRMPKVLRGSDTGKALRLLLGEKLRAWRAMHEINRSPLPLIAEADKEGKVAKLPTTQELWGIM